jgi:hypothetical protein
MEESTEKKLYSQKGISIATFFGGPLAAGYLIRQNFKALGKEREGLVSVILGILFTVLVIAPLFMLPEEIIDKIPNQLIPAIYTLIIYGIVEAVQGKDLKIHKAEQRPFESNWKATGIGALWMLVLVGVLAIYIFTSPEMTSEIDEEMTQKMEQIAVNEKKALKIYRMDLNTSTKEELLNAVKDEGIFYWNQNLQLLQEIQQYELEESYAKYVDKLFIYTRTRQETYILIMKSISEDTDKYNSEIEQKNRSIEVLMKEIQQMTL